MSFVLRRWTVKSETRRLINDVMKRAQRHIRRDITSFDKMNVDVMETDEGCIMILCFKGIKPKAVFGLRLCFAADG